MLARDLKPGDLLLWTGTSVPSDRTLKVVDRRKDDGSGWWMTDGSGLADYVWDQGTAWVRAEDLVSTLRDLRAEVVDLRRQNLALDAALDHMTRVNQALDAGITTTTTKERA